MRLSSISDPGMSVRLLDPKHQTRVPTLERALAALGRRAEIEVT